MNNAGERDAPLHIPLPFEKAIDGLLAVKPTKRVLPTKTAQAAATKKAARKAKKPTK
ncbi:MAG: hypothetical protein AABP62_24070 [Planctomycetota bacterium]